MTKVIISITILLLVSGKSFAEFPNDYIKKYKSDIQKKIPVDLNHLPKGYMTTLNWAGSIISIYHKTDDDKKNLDLLNKLLADPDGSFNKDYFNKKYTSIISKTQIKVMKYAYDKIDNKKNRTLIDNYFIFVRSSPATGCELVLKDSRVYNNNNRKLFYDPCSNTAYDAAGRVFIGTINNPAVKEKLAKYNISLTPYYVESETKIILGFNERNIKLPKFDFDHRELYKNKQPTQRLMIAARFNDKESINKALNDGARVDYFRIGEGSPIDSAIIGSSTKIVTTLLTLGAKPTHVSKQLANIFGRTDILELLKKY